MAVSAKAELPATTLAIIVLGVVVALYGIDKFLAAQEQREQREEAAEHYRVGQKLVKEGKTQEAADAFARAHEVDRNNRGYLLALADTQIVDKQFPAAHATLEGALDEDSNDGRANLLMARLMATEGRYDIADSYYHRAIYGEWPAGLSGERAKARLELADMLAAHGNSQELLSELLVLENDPSADMATREHIAGLFLRAGSPSRAADAYRRLVREDSNDADLYVGLGEAEITAGEYRAAENAFLGALRRRLNDPYIQSQLEMVARLATLDPTLRRLSSTEKYRRSVAIRDLALQELNACTGNTEAIAEAKPRAPINNEMAEAVLDDAEKIWKQHKQTCQQPSAPNDPLPVLMKKLAQ